MSQRLRSVMKKFGRSARRNARAAFPDGDPPLVLAIMAGTANKAVLEEVVDDLGWRLEIASYSNAASRSPVLRKAAIILYDKELNEPDWRKRIVEFSKLPLSPCVVLLSASQDETLWDEFVRCGGSDVVRSPLDPVDFKRAVQASLMLWRNQRYLRS